MSVMIVPFRKEGEEYRKLYDESKSVQIAIDKLKEGFDSKGFQVVDFVSAYDNAMTDATISGIKNQDDALSAIARNANTDILITVDVLPLMKTDLGNSVTIRLNAVDASTNYSYGTKVCASPSFNTHDSITLISRAISNSITSMQPTSALEDFLGKLQASFTSILQKGRPLKVVFGLGKNSMMSFSSTVDGQPLSVLINNWIKTTAYKNYSQMQSASDISMIYSDVRVPIKDNMGLNYSPFDFGSKITAYLAGKKLKVIQPYMKSGALYVTIN
jgi:predicted GTPase